MTRKFILKTARLIVALALVGMMTSCMYRMPTEADANVIPSTNNPTLTGDRASAMPNVAY